MLSGVLADARAGARLAVGTLTVFPVRVRRVDRAAARWAMLLAPLAGLPLAAAGAGVLVVAPPLTDSTLLAALLALGLLALLTRALHLDGLADLADGLGSGRPAEGAREIMRRSDIGPFGVVTLVFTIGVQVAALAQVVGRGAVPGALAVSAAVLAGRLAITWACRTRVPAARPEGLGALVAGTVPPGGAATATGAVLGVLALTGVAAGDAALAVGLPAAVLVALLAAEALRRHAVRRVGGITGDVLGALCETATTAALVAVAVAVAVTPGGG